MKIDWAGKLKNLLEVTGTTYEQRTVRTAVKIGFVALFVLVVWRLLK